MSRAFSTLFFASSLILSSLIDRLSRNLMGNRSALNASQAFRLILCLLTTFLIISVMSECSEFLSLVYPDGVTFEFFFFLGSTSETCQIKSACYIRGLQNRLKKAPVTMNKMSANPLISAISSINEKTCRCQVTLVSWRQNRIPN